MGSQDQDMKFINLVSQVPQLCPTRPSPVTIDESPPLPLNYSFGGKRSSRGVNFSPEEDKLLVSAWLNSNLDAVPRTDEKHSHLWEKIYDYFQQNKETTTERTMKSLIHRWSNIQKATNKFCDKLAQVEGLSQSGMTEQDKIEKARIMYHSVEKCHFQFDHCWHLLKDQPKWISLRILRADVKHRRTMFPTPMRCSFPVDDSVFDVETENVTEMDQPMGREAEKEKRKSQGTQTEETIQLKKMKHDTEFYLFKAEKMEDDKEKELRLEDERLRLKAKKLRIEAEKVQSKIRQKDERLRLKAEKMELAKKESDQRVMMMDVSAMPEMQRVYFEQLQKEIMTRRGHG